MLVLFVMNLKSNLFLINLKPENEISKKKRMNSGRLKLLIIFIDINDIELSAWYPKIISYVPRNIKNIKVKINLLDGLSTIDEEDITINEDNDDYAYGHI